MRVLLLQALALAAMSAASAAAQQGAQGAQALCTVSLNYEDADIRTFVDEIALRTGRKFVIDPRVQGRVTVKSGPNGGLCPEEAWEVFQAALRVNGFVATPISGNSYRILPVQEGPRSGGPVGDGVRGDLVTEVVRLTHIDAREAAANLLQILNERGVIAPIRSSNALIIVDSRDNIERLKSVIARIDRDTRLFRTLTLANASAIEVARIVTGLANELTDESGGQRGSVSVVPVEASNSILIRAEPAMLNRLAGIVAELDRMGGSRSGLSVIALDHADAEEMAPLLREIAGTSPGDATGATRARATISFHKPTNSIIINGDAEIQQLLRDVVTQLDIRRAQVLVEAIIVEVSDSTARELGLQYFISGDGSSNGRVPFTTTSFSRAQPNVLASAGAFLLDDDRFNNSQITQAALQSLLGLNGFALGGAGRLGDGSVFGAILTALKEDQNSRVLSFPSVTTVDNQPATLSVGQEIPITTGEAIGDNFANAFRTISRQEVGVILEVTPKINEGGTVTLLISQENSSVAGQIIATSTDLITNTSKIKTTALVDDGDILVIGGLIDQNFETIESKVPLLGDLPVAGNLFKTSRRSREQRHLMVFIKPTIIRDRNSAASATTRKLDYIKARELLSTGKPTSELEHLIDRVTGIGPGPSDRTAPRLRQ